MNKLMTAATVLLALCGGCQSGSETAQQDAAPAKLTSTPRPVPDRAEDVKPLGEGERAPPTTVRRPDGSAIGTAGLFAQKPTVLIFYRGGWCPYCTAHLGQIAKAEPELVKLGYQVVAVSPDSPEALRSSLDKSDYKHQLLSDSDMTLAQAFGLAFRVDAGTLTQYRGYGIDLEKTSGRDHHLLPVPTVYLIDQKGTIRFAHWNPDYKKRLQADELTAAARRVAGR